MFMSADRDSYTTRVMKMGPGHLQSCMEINHTTKQAPNRSGKPYSKKNPKPHNNKKNTIRKAGKKIANPNIGCVTHTHSEVLRRGWE